MSTIDSFDFAHCQGSHIQHRLSCFGVHLSSCTLGHCVFPTNVGGQFCFGETGAMADVTLKPNATASVSRYARRERKSSGTCQPCRSRPCLVICREPVARRRLGRRMACEIWVEVIGRSTYCLQQAPASPRSLLRQRYAHQSGPRVRSAPVTTSVALLESQRTPRFLLEWIGQSCLCWRARKIGRKSTWGGSRAVCRWGAEQGAFWKAHGGKKFSDMG